jgi:hypothetical protein
MPLHREPAFTDSREEFCLALKAARERKGITIAQIAASTKIASFHLAALERGDLRRWPKGLFRRSFFRDYVRMIGVPVADTCVEFNRWFPDDDGAAFMAQPATSTRVARADEVRLVLDAEWHGPRAAIRPRLIAASIDAATVVITAIVIAWAGGFGTRATTAMVALAYFFLATIVFGESPAKWIIPRRRPIIDALRRGRDRLTAWWKPREEPVEEPSPPLRVRFKLQ